MLMLGSLIPIAIVGLFSAVTAAKLVRNNWMAFEFFHILTALCVWWVFFAPSVIVAESVGGTLGNAIGAAVLVLSFPVAYYGSNVTINRVLFH